MKDTRWRHQIDGSEFSKDKEASLLWHGMGCIAGETQLQILKNKKGLKLSIEKLFQTWDGSRITIKTHKNNELRHSEIHDVIYSGVKKIYELKFTNEYSLKCTSDHRIATINNTWIQAKDLTFQHKILCNGQTVCRECGKSNHKIISSKQALPENIGLCLSCLHMGKRNSQYVTGNVKLISREYIGKIPTYDITMKYSNNFVGNGIIIHNSGKSYTGIGIAKDINAEKILIGCPKSVLPTWKSEFKKHGNNKFDVFVPLKGSVEKKAIAVETFLNKKSNKIKVIIINYESIWRPGFGHVYDKWKNIKDIGILRKIKWDLIIADEIQKIKAPGSKVSRFFKLLNKHSKKRLGLSGTPFPNSPLDVYGVYRFLDSEIFGTSFQRFRMKYAEWGGFENRQVLRYINQTDLNKKVYSIAHRVETEDVIELPPYTDIPVYCDLNNKAMKLYNEFKAESVIEFKNGEELSADNVLVKYLRLAQMASGIIKDDMGVEHIIDTTKFEALKDVILGIDEPIVIFTRFTAEVDGIIKMIEGFKKSGDGERKVCKLVGGTDEREIFQSGKADIIVVNIQAGGIGVNELVRARYGIYFSTGYGPGDLEQSKARIRRSGSDVEKKVFYYHIIARKTMDVVIMNAIKKKLNILETVLADFSRI